jgi:hypothetical protein
MARGTWPGTLALCLLGVTRPVLAEPARPVDAQAPWTWKRGLALGIVGTTYVGAWAFVSAAWWTRENESTHFAFHDEGAFGLGTYAGGADKLGHFYSNYLATRMYTDILEWGGSSRTVSMLSATILTTVFFTGVELKDGYQRNYGFSAGDIASNLTGQGAALAMMLVPSLDEAVSFKLMYFPSRDFRRAVSAGGRLNMPEDYSGQTYLLSFHLAALPLVKREDSVRALRYLDVSFGYATRGYEPIPKSSEPVRQVTSIGVSLNLQSVFDDLLGEPDEPRSTGAAIVHFINEVYQPPYTRISIFTDERRGPPLTRR